MATEAERTVTFRTYTSAKGARATAAVGTAPELDMRRRSDWTLAGEYDDVVTDDGLRAVEQSRRIARDKGMLDDTAPAPDGPAAEAPTPNPSTPAAPPAGGRLEQLTVAQLRDLAAEAGHAIPSKATKAQLISLLADGTLDTGDPADVDDDDDQVDEDEDE